MYDFFKIKINKIKNNVIREYIRSKKSYCRIRNKKNPNVNIINIFLEIQYILKKHNQKEILKNFYKEKYNVIYNGFTENKVSNIFIGDLLFISKYALSPLKKKEKLYKDDNAKYAYYEIKKIRDLLKESILI